MNFVEKGQVSVVCDGQFGSTGKGLIAAVLTEGQDVDIATTNASANAGHWTKYKDGTGFCCRHLPTAGIVNPDSFIYLNAGSIINPDVLEQEIESMKVDKNRIYIHPNAVIINPDDVAEEAAAGGSMDRISSTKQGVGAALSRKVRRSAMLAGDALNWCVDKLDLNTALLDGKSVTVEIPQGFSLSYHSQFYPYTTSRQCTVSQGLADAQIGLYHQRKVAMSLRTFPIRVGNTAEGFSGDCYPDQEETNFKDIGQIEERTTVTNKIRRIFTWSDLQYKEAILENGPDILFLNFCNYDPDYKEKVNKVISGYFDEFGEVPKVYLGHGPCVEDVQELGLE